MGGRDITAARREAGGMVRAGSGREGLGNGREGLSSGQGAAKALKGLGGH